MRERNVLMIGHAIQSVIASGREESKVLLIRPDARYEITVRRLPPEEPYIPPEPEITWIEEECADIDWPALRAALRASATKETGCGTESA